MLLHNAPDDSEAEPGPLLPGGDIGLADMVDHVGREARPVIADRHRHPLRDHDRFRRARPDQPGNHRDVTDQRKGQSERFFAAEGRGDHG